MKPVAVFNAVCLIQGRTKNLGVLIHAFFLPGILFWFSFFPSSHGQS